MPAPRCPRWRSRPRTFMLIFTSGSSGAPKACICSHGRVARLTQTIAAHCGHGPATVSYVTMPWFHAGAINTGWLPALAAGAATVIRKFGVASARRAPPRRDALQLRRQAARLPADRSATRRRRQQHLARGAGQRGRHRRRRALRTALRLRRDRRIRLDRGRHIDFPPPGHAARLPGAGRPGQRRRPRPGHRRAMPARAPRPGRRSGQRQCRDRRAREPAAEGAAGFEGYWRNPQANHKRVRNGIFWSGDLAFRDEQGHFWFAGRDDDWLRVDGENIASAQIEEILFRHADVVLAGVYAVPDPAAGDRVMAALQLRAGAQFDPVAFEAFLAAQPGSRHQVDARLRARDRTHAGDRHCTGPAPAVAPGAVADHGHRVVEATARLALSTVRGRGSHRLGGAVRPRGTALIEPPPRLTDCHEVTPMSMLTTPQRNRWSTSRRGPRPNGFAVSRR